ncbi:MAG: GAF domain-containing protein [Ignavibacteria bacterium]|nr:GAF domain-containing protein [Ignavibacteria bacterium]MDH7528032.1 GAF domain-containing protein [Ignavibacteria bacterium]
MIKLNPKRIIIFLILLGLLVASYLIDTIILKLFFILLTIIIISFIIFTRNGNVKSKEVIEDTNEENEEEQSNSAEDVQEFRAEDKILTEADIKERLLKGKVTQFVPQDLNVQYRKIALEEIPAGASGDVQFNFYLEKTLDVIKYVFMAHSAIFFWYRRDKNQIIFYNYSSDEDGLQKLKYEIGSDIISKVILTGNPNYTCNINSNVEADLIKYYQIPVGIKSIAAVPVFLNNKVIGVLAIDSKSEDAFGPETIYTLGKFVRMITLILNIYDERYNIELVNQKLDALLELIGNSTRDFDERKIVQNFIVVLDKFLEWDVLGIVLYDYGAKTYILKKVINRTSIDYMGEGLPVDVSLETLIGNAIRSGNSVKIDDSSYNKYFLYRKGFLSDIKGSLMIVPINSSGTIHGALVLENIKKKKYFDDDVRLVEKMANYFAFQLDNLLNKNLLDKYLSIDLETMLLNRQTFERKVSEVTKITAGEKHIGLALISVDRVDKLVKKYSPKVIPKIAKYIAMRLNKEAEDLMEIGRLETLKFGVLFINREPAVDNIWCQKIMQKISGEFIDYEDEKFGITVSIGYAGGTKNIRSETLFQSAETALNKAILDGGNKIRTVK